MKTVAAFMIAKGESLRLPGKNARAFHGRPLFEWNLQKLLHLGVPVCFDSDDEALLQRAAALGASTHRRAPGLCGHAVPSVPIFQDMVRGLAEAPDAILNLQANSPTCAPAVLEQSLAIARHVAFGELLTVYPDRRNNGSVWCFSYERLMNYGDPYTHRPDILIVDDSLDIHTIDDFHEAEKRFRSA